MAHTHAARGPQRSRPGFTLMELLAGIAVIFLLMGLLIGGIRYMSSSARAGADAATVAGLKDAVSQFKQQFGFLPPLVKDGAPHTTAGPLHSSGNAPLAYSLSDPNDRNFLRNEPPGTVDLRFSIRSLPIYTMGVLDSARRSNPGIPIDGVAGPRFKAVKRDGGFETTGRDFSPFFDISRNSKAVYETEPGSGKFEFRDPRGVAYRYYRWLHDDGSLPSSAAQVAGYLNVPELVGDPTEAGNVALRSAEYAIVSAGPNGLFGDEHKLPAGHPQSLSLDDMAGKLGIRGSAAALEAKIIDAAKADNVVEVGQ